MKKGFFPLLIICSLLIMKSHANAETSTIPKLVNVPAHASEDQTIWLAKDGIIKSFEGKAVLTGMTMRQNSLEIMLTERFFYQIHALSQPSRLEIEIQNAVNGLGADLIDINKLGIAKIMFFNADSSLRFVLFPAEGAPLPTQFEVIDNSRGLLIHTAALLKEPHSAPVVDKPAIPSPSTPPAETITPSTLTAKSTPAPIISVSTKILPDNVILVATPVTKSNVTYSLIAGESLNLKKINPVVEKLTAAGFKPDVANVTREVEVFRLVAACFAESKPAEMKLARIASRTKQAFIARDGGSYCVYAGSLMSEESARKEQKRLAAKGLKGLQIIRVKVPLKVWRVIVGRNADGLEAAKSIRDFARIGIVVGIDETGN